jgi:hypothetical protein
MPKKTSMSIAAALSERFSDVWKLLSETTAFLSRTQDFAHYEPQLRAWRAALNSARTDMDLAHRIRTELVELRKGLRLQGYDLSLASHELRFEGFRNDACIREGFRRLVLFFSEDDLFWLAGDDNHIALAEYMETRLEASGGHHVKDRHYLWFKRQGNVLILSGSDTEAKDDFARLVAIGEANSLHLLGKLKGLK